MKKIKLTKEEQKIEDELVKGAYFDVGKSELVSIAESVASRKRNAILNIRVNEDDIKAIKNFARKYGIGYQTLIAELIHKTAKNL